MKFLIVTGMSGAGKSHALRFLEDRGFFCVDNLPPSLLPKFAEVCTHEASAISHAALGIDIRGGKVFDDLFDGMQQLTSMGIEYAILFLDADDQVLARRFKETRRSHPLSGSGPIADSIKEERSALEALKSKADFIIDTSNLLPKDLKEQIDKIVQKGLKYDNLIINIISFGFKYGIPQECDLVFDVRFIPNPFYISSLKMKTGNDVEVSDYVLGQQESLVFLEKTIDLLKFLIPNYIKEGKNKLVIGIGCTGGRHRSVTLSNEIHNSLTELGHSVTISHNDILRRV